MATLQSFKTDSNLASKQAIRGLISQKTDNNLVALSTAIARISATTNINLTAINGDLLRQWHLAIPPVIYVPPVEALATVGQVLPR